jgi:hypothetical protein
VLTTLLFASLVATQFPGPGRCVSPDGRYSIVWKAPTSATEAHRLLLKNEASGTSSQLCSFNRHVSVLWAPDSGHFAITDWVGSDGSVVVIMRAADPETRVVVDTERVQKATSISVTGDHHTYVEAVRWLSSHELLFRVHGYGEEHPNGFKRLFIFRTIGQSISLAPPGT